MRSSFDIPVSLLISPTIVTQQDFKTARADKIGVAIDLATPALFDHPMPDMDHYRRIQLAWYIMDENLSRSERFAYDQNEKIDDFGISAKKLDQVIDSGQPFRTSGCEGYDGEVACNRPFANSRPGPGMRNYPFEPNKADILLIRKQLYNRSGIC